MYPSYQSSYSAGDPCQARLLRILSETPHKLSAPPSEFCLVQCTSLDNSLVTLWFSAPPSITLQWGLLASLDFVYKKERKKKGFYCHALSRIECPSHAR